MKYIHITGTLWFQATYGNTYHKCYITMFENGEKRNYKSEIRYGYGSTYLQTAEEILIEKGEISGERSFFDLVPEKPRDYILSYQKIHVARRKDL